MSDAAPATAPAVPPPPPPPPVPAVDAAPPPPPPVAPAPPAEPAAPTEPPATRFDVITKQKWDAIRRAEAAEARLAELQRSQQPAAPATQPATPGDPPAPQMDQAAINRAAAQMVAQREFDQRCDRLATTAKGKYNDFDSVLGNFQIIGGLGNQIPLVQAMIADGIDNGADVLYHLGKNIAEADRISQLSPVQLAIEVAQLSHKLKSAAPPPVSVSQAPAPITPIAPAAPSAPVAEPDAAGDFKSQAEYKAWRQKNKKR